MVATTREEDVKEETRSHRCTSCHVHMLQVFETTIRIIGGLLSAYSLRSHLATLPGNHTGSHAKDIILLEKAVQLGEMLMPVSVSANKTKCLPSLSSHMIMSGCADGMAWFCASGASMSTCHETFQ
jgi:hypothetical protein